MTEDAQDAHEALRAEHRHLLAHVDQIRSAGGEVANLAPEERDGVATMSRDHFATRRMDERSEVGEWVARQIRTASAESPLGPRR